MDAWFIWPICIIAFGSFNPWTQAVGYVFVHGYGNGNLCFEVAKPDPWDWLGISANEYYPYVDRSNSVTTLSVVCPIGFATNIGAERLPGCPIHAQPHRAWVGYHEPGLVSVINTPN